MSAFLAVPMIHVAVVPLCCNLLFGGTTSSSYCLICLEFPFIFLVSFASIYLDQVWLGKGVEDKRETMPAALQLLRHCVDYSVMVKIVRLHPGGPKGTARRSRQLCPLAFSHVHRDVNVAECVAFESAWSESESDLCVFKVCCCG
jgi:hypothetical protein